MKKAFRMMLALVFVGALTGCTVRLVDFTIISTKNVDLARAASFQRGKQRVEGKDSATIIIIIPTGVPNVKEAIDRAIESVPGGIALVDGVLTQESWWFIFGMNSYIVEGTPLIDTTLASNELKSNFMIAKLNRHGELKELRYVDRAEYSQAREKYIARHRQTKL